VNIISILNDGIIGLLLFLTVLIYIFAIIYVLYRLTKRLINLKGGRNADCKF
jgi:hypothetical protein